MPKLKIVVNKQPKDASNESPIVLHIPKDRLDSQMSMDDSPSSQIQTQQQKRAYNKHNTQFKKQQQLLEHLAMSAMSPASNPFGGAFGNIFDAQQQQLFMAALQQQQFLQQIQTPPPPQQTVSNPKS